MPEIGNIVTVLLECAFRGFQGEVVEIEHDEHECGPIGVQFGTDVRLLFGIDSEKEGNIIRFKPENLRVDEDWTFETKAKRLGGMSWGYKLVRPRSSSNSCMVEHCLEEAVDRVVYNVHGVVLEADMCAEDVERYSNKWLDEFPPLKKLGVNTA